MKIILDFDGTVVKHEFPKIGIHNKYSDVVLKKLKEAGHQIILNTYRADIQQQYLLQAIKYVQQYIQLDGYYKNKVNPPIFNMDKYIENEIIYIDDIAIGIPLIDKMVNWYELDNIFKQYNLYK